MTMHFIPPSWVDGSIFFIRIPRCDPVHALPSPVLLSLWVQLPLIAYLAEAFSKSAVVVTTSEREADALGFFALLAYVRDRVSQAGAAVAPQCWLDDVSVEIHRLYDTIRQGCTHFVRWDLFQLVLPKVCPLIWMVVCLGYPWILSCVEYISWKTYSWPSELVDLDAPCEELWDETVPHVDETIVDALRDNAGILAGDRDALHSPHMSSPKMGENVEQITISEIKVRVVRSSVTLLYNREEVVAGKVHLMEFTAHLRADLEDRRSIADVDASLWICKHVIFASLLGDGPLRFIHFEDERADRVASFVGHTEQGGFAWAVRRVNSWSVPGWDVACVLVMVVGQHGVMDGLPACQSDWSGIVCM